MPLFKRAFARPTKASPAHFIVQSDRAGSAGPADKTSDWIDDPMSRPVRSDNSTP